MHRIVILGGGTGGTLTADRLRKAYSPDDAEITVVDQDDRHVYQPGLLFVPFGLTRTADIIRPRGGQLHAGIGYRTTGVDHVDLGGLLAERGIALETEFDTGEVDGAGGRLISFDDREIPFDLAVVVPAHNGAPCIARSTGMGDVLGFVPTDQHTLQSTVAAEVFVAGDAASLPVSKAGSVAHFEGEVVVENVRRFLAGQPLDASYDGHANCFIGAGFHRAVLIDFNYDMEPPPGHFPGPVGSPPMRNSRLNHLGKLMRQWIYRHGLLPGRDLPGLHSAMPTAGKKLAVHA